MTNFFSRLTILLLIAAIACSEDEPEVPRGTLIGRVQSNSVFEGKTTLLSGVEVTLEGTKPLRTFTTDASGLFKATDLSMGTYHIKFSKPGYGTFKLQGYPFVGGNAAASVTVTLYTLPTIEIKDVTAKIEKGNSGSIWVRSTILIDLPQADTYGLFRYYFSDKPDVSPARYRETKLTPAFYQNVFHTHDWHINTTKFPPGSDLYMVVYPCSEESSSYPDLETGNRVFASVSEKHSAVVQLKVPN